MHGEVVDITLNKKQHGTLPSDLSRRPDHHGVSNIRGSPAFFCHWSRDLVHGLQDHFGVTWIKILQGQPCPQNIIRFRPSSNAILPRSGEIPLCSEILSTENNICKKDTCKRQKPMSQCPAHGRTLHMSTTCHQSSNTSEAAEPRSAMDSVDVNAWATRNQCDHLYHTPSGNLERVSGRRRRETGTWRDGGPPAPKWLVLWE